MIIHIVSMKQKVNMWPYKYILERKFLLSLILS